MSFSNPRARVVLAIKNRPGVGRLKRLRLLSIEFPPATRPIPNGGALNNDLGQVLFAALIEEQGVEKGVLLVATPHVGDANLNGHFDSTDLTAVLQSGKYRTGQPADWTEGDWNGDGVFDQLDLVAALQAGDYLRGPSATSVVDIVFREG